GEVAGGRAADGGKTEFDRLADRDRDDALLVRVRRVVARVVLDVELLAAELFCKPVRALQRREAGMEPGLRLIDGQKVLVAPQTLRPARDRLARDLPLHLRVVVLDLVRPEALLADVNGRHRRAVAAFLAFQSEYEAHGTFLKSRRPLPVRR